MSGDAKYEVVKGEDGQWYFHLKAANGEIVSQSEGYSRREDAELGVESAQRAAAAAEGADPGP